MTARGFFIVLEGPEGSGKSTLVEPLARLMREAGVDPVVVREPGSTKAAEIVRQVLLDPEHSVGPLAELFLYPAARADLVQRVVEPALAAGRTVLSDRFALTTEAYQMAGRGIPAEVVLPANRAAAGGLRPDLTLIIDLPAEIGRARQEAAGKRLDRIERETPEFHRRVNEFYLAVQGDGVRHLDGRQGPDQLLQAAWREIVASAPGRLGPARD